MHTTQEEFNKGFIRMMDSLRQSSKHAGELNCNGVKCNGCPLNGCCGVTFGEAISNSFTIMQIVWDWNQAHPIVTNIDHYAKELGWEDKQKERVLKYGVPLPNYFKEPSKSVTDDWWDEEYHAPDKE